MATKPNLTKVQAHPPVRYRLTELSFIGNRLRQPGEIITVAELGSAFDGKPGDHMIPVDEKGRDIEVLDMEQEILGDKDPA